MNKKSYKIIMLILRFVGFILYLVSLSKLYNINHEVWGYGIMITTGTSLLWISYLIKEEQ